MPIPQITKTIGGLEYFWEEHSIYIYVKKIKAHSDGRVGGEITLLNDKRQILYPATLFNFTADRTRNTLAKTLNNMDSTHPWSEIINSLSVSVIDLARKGEPVQELWTSADVPELEYLLEPILIKGVPTIIFGEKGVAKSTLALVIYFCLILPWHDNPLGLIAPKKSVKSLILDYELPGYISQRNAKKFQEGMRLGPIPLYHRRCSSPLSDEIEQIANHIEDLGTEVLIIDSLARACGGELNKTEPANNFFEALDKLNTTSLILAQTSKDVDTKRKTVFGSSMFTYYARSIFELCKQEALQDDILDIALFHRWANLTKLHPDMGFRINYNHNHINIERQSISIGEFLGKVTTQKAILNELKSGALSVPELVERCGGNENSLRVILSKLKRREVVVNLERGLWELQ